MHTTYAKVATAVAALLLPTAAQAKETVLKQSGAWKTVVTQNSNTGSALCAMSIVNSDGRKFYIKYSDGRLFTQMFRTSWRLKGKQGAKVRMTIQFDDHTARDGVAIANIDQYGNSFLNVHISAEKEGAFLQEVAEANDGVVSFPDGDEKPWGLRMVDSRDVFSAFRSCMTTLEKRDAALPQPTAKYQPSEPQTPNVVPMEEVTVPAKKKGNGSI